MAVGLSPARWTALFRVWDLETGAELRIIRGRLGKVGALPVAPDGRRVVCGSLDGSLKVWDLETGAKLHT
jgi:WD40 repeat protein